ncbi:MAG: MFS transporter [Pirellula sp.]
MNDTNNSHKRGVIASLILTLAVGMMSFGFLVGYHIIPACAGATKGTSDASNAEKASDVANYQAFACLAAALSVVFAGYIGRRISWPAIGLGCTLLLFVSSILLATNPAGNQLSTLSRIVFGIGFAVVFVVQDSVLAKSIPANLLTYAFGLVLVMDRIAELLTFNVGASTSNAFGISFALWIAVGIAAVTIVSSLAVWFMAKTSERSQQVDLRRLLFSHSTDFWILNAVTTLVYSSYFAFMAFGVLFLQESYGLEKSATTFDLAMPFETAAAVLGSAPGVLTIIHILAVFLTFVAAWYIRKNGKRVEMMLLGTAIFLVSLLIFYAAANPILGIATLGIGLVLITTPLWPAVSLLSQDDAAYVLVTVPQYIGIAGFVWLSGFLRETTGSYASGLLLSVVLAFLAIVLLLVLLFADKRNGGVLAMSENQRRSKQ